MTRSLVSLRAATPADAPYLAELWAEVLRRAGREDQVADVEALLERVAGNDDERVVVAEYDGEVAGAVHLQRTTVTAINPERVVRALAPHVFPRYQRHGVGTALIEAAVSWAEELGIAHVSSGAVAGSRDANRFLARIALGPYAVVRIAPVHAVRSRINARRPAQAVGGRQLTQVLAARRSLRRSRATAEG
jgi:GNAT superfamily N-acetyltransferase